MRKLIAFDKDTFARLCRLGCDRIATIHALVDQAIAVALSPRSIPAMQLVPVKVRRGNSKPRARLSRSSSDLF